MRVDKGVTIMQWHRIQTSDKLLFPVLTLKIIVRRILWSVEDNNKTPLLYQFRWLISVNLKRLRCDHKPLAR